MLTDDDRRGRIRSALRLLIDPSLPWVHDDDNPNCGECWECIAGTLGVARAMRRSGLQVSGALDVPDALVYLQSDLAQAQSRVRELEAQLGEMIEIGFLSRGLRGHHSYQFRLSEGTPEWFYRDSTDDEPLSYRLFVLRRTSDADER